MLLGLRSHPSGLLIDGGIDQKLAQYHDCTRGFQLESNQYKLIVGLQYPPQNVFPSDFLRSATWSSGRPGLSCSPLSA